MKALADKINAEGAIDLKELNTLLAMSGQNPSGMTVDKFNELDTNGDGKIEESEVKSGSKGEDYDLTKALGGLCKLCLACSLLNLCPAGKKFKYSRS